MKSFLLSNEPNFPPKSLNKQVSMMISGSSRYFHWQTTFNGLTRLVFLGNVTTYQALNPSLVPHEWKFQKFLAFFTRNISKSDRNARGEVELVGKVVIPASSSGPMMSQSKVFRFVTPRESRNSNSFSI
jgi:hypothetical protein